jgi:hypothetical protein
MTQLSHSNFPVRDKMACVNQHRGELEILNSRRGSVQAISKLLILSRYAEKYGRDLQAPNSGAQILIQ